MPLSEAVTFLFARTGSDNGSRSERTAASATGYLTRRSALALEQAAIFITTHDTPFQDYLTSYSKRQLERLNKSKPVCQVHQPAVGSPGECREPATRRDDQLTWRYSIGEQEKLSLFKVNISAIPSRRCRGSYVESHLLMTGTIGRPWLLLLLAGRHGTPR